MELLEAAMAFAVVMIVFSTMTTALSELTLRANRMRGKCLERAIDALFEEVVWPRFRQSFQSTTDEGEAEDNKQNVKSDFIAGVLNNPARHIQMFGAIAALPSFLTSWLSVFAKDEKVSVLTPIAFAERLGRTKIGQAILAEGDAQLKIVIEDFIRTFDRYSRASVEVFRRNAQVTAMFLAIVLAFVANIDSGRLFMSLMEKPALREALIEDAGEAIAANEEAISSLEDALEGNGSEAIAANEEAISSSEDALEKNGVDQGELAVAIEKNKASLKNINELREQGLPIGPDYFPYNKKMRRERPKTPESNDAELSEGRAEHSAVDKGANADSRTKTSATGDVPESDSKKKDELPVFCIFRKDEKKPTGHKGTVASQLTSSQSSSDAANKAPLKWWSMCEVRNSKEAQEVPQYRRQLLHWFFLTLLSGILIGLGGPFWFRVFASLSQLFQLLRAFGYGKERSETKPEEVSVSPEVEASYKPKDITGAFKTAAIVHSGGSAIGGGV